MVDSMPLRTAVTPIKVRLVDPPAPSSLLYVCSPFRKTGQFWCRGRGVEMGLEPGLKVGAWIGTPIELSNLKPILTIALEIYGIKAPKRSSSPRCILVVLFPDGMEG